MRPVATTSERTPPRAATPVRAPSRFPLWLPAVLLVLVTMALYWPVTGHDFVNYDDNEYVLNNPHVTSGLTLENARWALGSGYAVNWHPVTWLSHMLDCQLFGLKPWGHHFTSVLLHAFNALLVFTLLRQMTGAGWRSLLVAALFALHPLRVESVAWVAERKDVLSGCFGLLSLVFYARYVRRTESTKQKAETGAGVLSSGQYWLSLLFFALGLMSKPMLVTWPFVMLLLDYWPLRRFEVSTLNPQPSTVWRLAREKVPFFALAAAVSIVTFVVQKQGGAAKAAQGLPLGARSGNALISYCRYLAKLFWPTDLAVFYPHPGHWPLIKVLLAGGLILGISVLFLLQRRRYPFLLMGWLWFVGTLVPVIGLVQVGTQAMADRYSYIPTLGVLILTVWGAYELTRRWHYGVMVLSVAGCAAIVSCLALTRQQLRHWQDSETLFRHALEVTDNSDFAHKTLGVALAKKGQMDEAIRQFQQALLLKPDYAEVHYSLGTALAKTGQLDEAISEFQQALRLNPDYAEAHYNLGLTLGKKGQMDEAIRQYQQAIRLRPDYPLARNNLATALYQQGRAAEAIGQFQEALRLKPDYADAHYNLGLVFAREGQTDEAILQFQKTLRLKPDYADARKHLDVALATRAPSPPQPGASTNR